MPNRSSIMLKLRLSSKLSDSRTLGLSDSLSSSYTTTTIK